jgi:alanyl-tRNA synthetase
MIQIEALVAQAIHANTSLDERRAVPIEEAKALGAMALFGEKYGANVRVIKFGDSVELCGGIHVPNTASIGLFTIISESAVAAGIRRIEAISGAHAEQLFREKAAQLDQVNLLLRNPKDLNKAIEDLLLKNQTLTKELELVQKDKAKVLKQELKNKIVSIKDINFLSAITDLDATSVKDILFQLKGEVSNFIGIIGTKDADKCTLNLYIAEPLVASKSLNAAKIIQGISKHIQGGGGGQSFFATAGGKDSNGLTTAIKEFEELVNQLN